jgi:hypothetical protein
MHNVSTMAVVYGRQQLLKHPLGVLFSEVTQGHNVMEEFACDGEVAVDQ